MRYADDRYAKTVRIRVTVDNGRVVELGKEDLPCIRNGTFGELVIDLDALANPGDRERLASEGIVEFLPAGSDLWVRVSPQSIPDALRRHAIKPKGVDGPFVRVVLAEPLRLRVRGTKPGTLLGARCVIPALGEEAKSLNHAYRLVSERFEPHRMSHSGNVFEEVFLAAARGYKPLDLVRDFVATEWAATNGGGPLPPPLRQNSGKSGP